MGIVIKIVALLLFISILFYSLFGFGVEKQINNHFVGLDKRVGSNQLTALDKIECKILYRTMVLIGRPIYREASQILHHYIDGNGKPLNLNSDYIKTSPVVHKALRSMKAGESKEVRFKQHEDWRLSYALNPFILKKEQNRVRIYQRIVFRNEKGVYTNLNLFFFKVKLPDRLIYALNPKPYTVYSEWEE